MRIVFMGTPNFAVKPFNAIFTVEGVEVVAAVTNRDKPVGRKQILTPPPVKTEALKRGVKVLQYDKIRMENGAEDLRKLKPDLIVTCAFGQILSQEILDIPKLGVINIHASLLPKFRGASPIHYAIMEGESKTGVTIMRTDIGIDTGDILISESVDVGENQTCGELFEVLSELGAKLIVKALRLIKNGKAEYTPQPTEGVSLTKIIKKEDALLDFSKSAKQVVDKIRAFNPAPKAYAYLNGEQFKFISARVNNEYVSACAGEIIECEKKLVISCAENAVEILEIQRQGGKPMNISDFLRGNKLNKGENFTKC